MREKLEQANLWKNPYQNQHQNLKKVITVEAYSRRQPKGRNQHRLCHHLQKKVHQKRKRRYQNQFPKRRRRGLQPTTTKGRRNLCNQLHNQLPSLFRFKICTQKRILNCCDIGYTNRPANG